jgi:hypothetical protein
VGFSPGFLSTTVETLIIIHNLSAGSGHKPGAIIDCLESIARWCQQIQAGSLCYLRRCQVAAGTRKRLQEDLHTSRARPESKVARLPACIERRLRLASVRR